MGTSTTTVTDVTELRARSTSSDVLHETALALDFVTSDGTQMHLFAWCSDPTLAAEYADAIGAVNDRRRKGRMAPWLAPVAVVEIRCSDEN